METTVKCRVVGIFYLIWLMAGSVSFVIAPEPPQILTDYRNVIHARRSDRIQLTCPVRQLTKDLLFSWMKDNESISPAWIRFQMRGTGAHLVITDVDAEDTGTYTCIATNGFGSQRADILLIVEETDSDGGRESSENVNDDLLIEGLSFTNETLRQPRQVRLTVGSSLDIQCTVAGYPYPDLIWLKDGVIHRRLRQDRPDETSWKVSKLALSIRQATSDSSGNYTCLALGLRERIQTSFDIHVLHASERIDISRPTNASERRGGKAVFFCWVNSSSEPEVEWFKRLPDQSGRLHPNTSLIVGEHQYQGLKSEELALKEDGSYLKKLIVNPLSEKDSGLYLCLGTNRYGYNIQKTYLNVEPNYQRDAKSVPFSIMVALPSILILTIAGCFVWWMREREKQRRLDLLPCPEPEWNQEAYTIREEEEAIESEIGQHSGSRGACHNRQTLMSSPGSHLLNEEEIDGTGRELMVNNKATGRPDGRHLDVQPNYYLDGRRHHAKQTGSSLLAAPQQRATR